MSEWEALIGTRDFLRGGIDLAWRRRFDDGWEYSNGVTNWRVVNHEGVEPDIEPLHVRDDQARSLLAALLRHYNGADDARMLRKDYDAERARVDKLIDGLMSRSAVDAKGAS